jgi:hypothetical protein
MRQALFKCETPRLKLKSLPTFLAIKRCERTKIGKVMNQSRSSKLRWAHICIHSRIPVNGCHYVAGGNDVLSSLSTCVFGVEDTVFQQKKDRKKRSHQPTIKGVCNALTQVFLSKCCVGGGGVSTIRWLVPDFGEGGRSIGD